MATFNHYNYRGRLIRRSTYFTKEAHVLGEALDKITTHSCNFIKPEDFEVYMYCRRIFDQLTSNPHCTTLSQNRESATHLEEFEQHYLSLLIPYVSTSSIIILLEALGEIPLHLPAPKTEPPQTPSYINLSILQELHQQSLDQISKKYISDELGISRPTFDKHISSQYKKRHHSYLWILSCDGLQINLQRQEVINRIMNWVDDLLESGLSTKYAVRKIVESLFIHLPQGTLEPIIRNHLEYRDGTSTN